MRIQARIFWSSVLFLSATIILSSEAMAQSLAVGVEIDWHPNGSMLSVVSDATVQIIDANTQWVLNTISGLQVPVTDVTWSPDGNKIAVANGTEVQIWEYPWDTNSAQLLFTFHGHNRTVATAVWNPIGDGRMVTTSLGTALIWDTSTGQILHTLVQEPGPIDVASWNPDGTIVATGGVDSLVYFWDAATGLVLGGYHMPISSGIVAVTAIAWSPDGTQLATATEEGVIDIWSGTVNDPSSWSPITFSNHSGLVIPLEWNPDSRRLASASEDGTVRVWDVLDRRELLVIPTNVFSSVAWNPNGSELAYSGTGTAVEIVPSPNVELPTSTPAPTSTPTPTEMALPTPTPTLTPPPSTGGPNSIPFATSPNGATEFDIYRINPDGTNLVRLTNVPGNDAFAAWSPENPGNPSLPRPSSI